jgi:hypothetical protein
MLVGEDNEGRKEEEGQVEMESVHRQATQWLKSVTGQPPKDFKL